MDRINSTYVVNLITSICSAVPWFYKAWSNAFLCFISTIDFQVSHMLCESNKVAYCLQKAAINVSSMTWSSSLSDFCILAHYGSLVIIVIIVLFLMLRFWFQGLGRVLFGVVFVFFLLTFFPLGVLLFWEFFSQGF